MNERRNDLEIMNWAPQIALQTQNSDQSPLYDVRNPARASHKDATCEVMFRGRYVQGLLFKACLLFKASIFNLILWSQTGSNRRPHACKARALPAELWPRTRRRMPRSIKWWAWEDLNFRPHAYQARALTN